jgi:hypothetical protein
MGKSGRAILQALIDGEREPDALHEFHPRRADVPVAN